MRPISLEPWVHELLVDPLGKESLTRSRDGLWLVTSYGRRYPIREQTLDFRILRHDTTKDQRRWREGQAAFERWANDAPARDAHTNYEAEREGVRDVYADIPIEGRCLDVGGHQGRLRAFMSPRQPYVSCDPFLDPFLAIDRQPNLLRAYPFLAEPVNFLACDAEFLPFRPESFRTVHMRSVIDHLYSPELALNEAYRVLEPGGGLIVGLYVTGGRKGRMKPKAQAKEAVRAALVGLGFHRFKDHHIWHPTYQELRELIEKCGFAIDRVHWQKGYDETVCYIRGIKQPRLYRL